MLDDHGAGLVGAKDWDAGPCSKTDTPWSQSFAPTAARRTFRRYGTHHPKTRGLQMTLSPDTIDTGRNPQVREVHRDKCCLAKQPAAPASRSRISL